MIGRPGGVFCLLLTICLAENRVSSGRKESAVSVEEQYDQLLEFLSWLKEKGARLNGVELSTFPEMGWGVRATRELKKGEVITETPLSCVLSLEHAVVDEEFGRALGSDRLEYVSDTNAMALFIAYQRQLGGAESPWQPYLAFMPKHIPLTLYFQKKEMEQMAGSMVQQFAKHRNAAVEKVFKHISNDLDKHFSRLFSTLTKEDFLWALSVVWSRSHRVRARDPSGNWQSAAALVPLADMFNMAATADEHNVVCNTNDESTHFECRTTQPVKKGSQLQVLYSSAEARHNGRLIMDYGFVLRNNPWNSVSIRLPAISGKNSLQELRSELWQRVPVWRAQMVTVKGSQHLPQDLLAVARFLHLREQELVAMKGMLPQRILEFLTQPLPIAEIELASVKWTIDWLKSSLTSYPTTTSIDESLLASGDLPTHLELIVVHRLAEKELLLAVISRLEQYSLSLSSRDTHFEL